MFTRRLITRRQALKNICFWGSYAATVRFAAAAQAPPPSTLQSGDLLWPKKPGAYVPYHAGAPDKDTDKQIWLTQKREFLERIRREPTYLSASQVRELENLQYEEFHLEYTRGTRPGQLVPYSSGEGIISVGHVAIIHMDRSAPTIIEAMPSEGVTQKPYKAWFDRRSDHLFLHGRINVSAEDRSLIASEALKHVGKPYDFWNFDLNNDEGFYCSKLAWLSCYRAIGLALDGDHNTKRWTWYSPKQLFSESVVNKLYIPND